LVQGSANVRRAHFTRLPTVATQPPICPAMPKNRTDDCSQGHAGSRLRVTRCSYSISRPYFGYDIFPRTERKEYAVAMTKLLEQALEAVRRLPPDSQDEIARAMLQLASRGEPEVVDAAHLPAVLERLAQAQRREFASEAEVEAAFRRFDR